MQGKSLTASIAKQAAIKANAIQRRNRQEDNIKAVIFKPRPFKFLLGFSTYSRTNI